MFFIFLRDLPELFQAFKLFPKIANGSQPLTTRFFCKQHFNKQRQAEIGKNWSKLNSTLEFAIWK